MITPVVMPQMGLEVTEGTVAAIHVAVGAHVSEGDPLIEMETDKALTDVVAPRDGVVRAVEVEVGDTVEIGASLVLLAETADEPVEETAVVAAPAGAAERSAAAAPAQAAPAVAGGARTMDGRPRAAPVARRAARLHGVDLERVEGTGPRGRITLGDVERAAAALGTNGTGARDGATATPTPAPPAQGAKDAPAAAAPEATPAEEQPPTPTPTRATARPAAGAGERVEVMSPTRAAIARRMTESQRIPQFALEREIDASWLLEQKAQLARDGSGIGVNDLLLQAMAEMVRRHPALAASYVEPESGARPALLHRERVDLGLAVASARGLLVPVLRGADELTLAQLVAERGRLVGAARSGRLALEDMGGAAMTLSNLSSFGVDRFTAMVNPGESAILAVGRVVERVVPRGRGTAVVPALSCTLTIDHRVADGATGAAALVELAELLEGGMTWRR